MAVLDSYWWQRKQAHRRRCQDGKELSFLSQFTLVINRLPGIESVEDRRCSERKIIRS